MSTSVQKLAILVDPISTLQSRYCWYLKGHLQPQHITQNTQQPRTKMSRVGILPDGHIRTNPLLPQIPTKHSVPTSRERLPGYFGIPMAIPTLRSLIGPALNKVQTPWHVGILPDGHIRTNPLLPQIPTKHSVPTSRERLPGYFGIPMVIPTLHSLIGPALNKVRTPWLSFH